MPSRARSQFVRARGAYRNSVRNSWLSVGMLNRRPMNIAAANVIQAAYRGRIGRGRARMVRAYPYAFK